MNAEFLLVIPAALGGVAISAIVACIPGMHIYNVMGLLVLALLHGTGNGTGLSPEVLTGTAIGLVGGYSVFNTVPAILLSAPDESSMFTVLPGQKLFLRGRGIDAVAITAIGSAAGLLLLMFVMAPLAPVLLPDVYRTLQLHTHWIIWCVIIFMLMSEWPRTAPSGQAGWFRFLNSCKNGFLGIIVFLLSGLLGFILFYSPITSAGTAFQNLMPAFIGLFTLPWLILNIAVGTNPPQQNTNPTAGISSGTVSRGALAGALGGGFAAFFPVVTGGVGGFLAGHATAINDSRTFLISQGASKLIYYTGGLLLFFVPGLEIRRGGGAWMINGLMAYSGRYQYLSALLAAAVSGSAALLLILPLSRLVLRLIGLVGFRLISIIALGFSVMIVIAVNGIPGAGIMVVAAGIGLLPVLFGTRRMNCLGVIMLPLACNMSGAGVLIAHKIGLI